MGCRRQGDRSPGSQQVPPPRSCRGGSRSRTQTPGRELPGLQPRLPAVLFVLGALAAASGVWPQHIRLRRGESNARYLLGVASYVSGSAVLGLDGGEASFCQVPGDRGGGRGAVTPVLRTRDHSARRLRRGSAGEAVRFGKRAPPPC